jgi:hypothetical protein
LTFEEVDAAGEVDGEEGKGRGLEDSTGALFDEKRGVANLFEIESVNEVETGGLEGRDAREPPRVYW